MAKGPEDQIILGQDKIPYWFKCYRLNNFPQPFRPFPDKSGIYVFADLSRSKSNNVDDIDLKVLYVGCTQSFCKRITEEHEEWDKAIKLKATHVCILDEASENRRIEIERDIYETHNPPLNDKRP